MPFVRTDDDRLSTEPGVTCFAWAWEPVKSRPDCGPLFQVRFILTRRNTRNGLAYREDPTILAWDLINEPRCETWKASSGP